MSAQGAGHRGAMREIEKPAPRKPKPDFAAIATTLSGRDLALRSGRTLYAPVEFSKTTEGNP
jgi:hypothetical protein